MDYLNFIKDIAYNTKKNIMIGGGEKDWIDNFNSLYEKVENITPTNKRLHIIPMIDKHYLRDMAFDDKMKKKKKGIYRVKYEDVNDLDKKKNPKIKFKYYHLSNDKPVTEEEQLQSN